VPIRSVDPIPLTHTTLGFGTMQLTGPRVLGPPSDWMHALSLLRTAHELGVELFDTAWYYGPNVTHTLLVEAFGPRLKNLTIVTKAGNSRGPTGSWIPALAPAQLRQAVETDLRLLHVDAPPLALLRWNPTPRDLPQYMDSLATMTDLQEAGHIRRLGLSNVTRDHLLASLAVTRVAAVSNAYSAYDRRDLPVVEICATNRIPFLPYYPLLAGEVAHRAALQKVSRQWDLTPAQLAIAWLKAQPGVMVPIAGTRRVPHLRENVLACSVSPSLQLLADIEQAVAQGSASSW